MVVAKKSKAQITQRRRPTPELEGAAPPPPLPSMLDIGSASPGRGPPLSHPPDLAGGEFVSVDRLRPHGDAVAGPGPRQGVGVSDNAGVDEVLVEVVDVLAQAVLGRAAHRAVVEDRQVVHVFPEPNPPPV